LLGILFKEESYGTYWPMKVSVCIPTYNSSSTIQQTLDSVLRQTSSPAEILVLDDGSSDNTVSLLRGYGSRIDILRQPNRGVAVARNRLSETAVGDLVAFLDHDDIWHPCYLAEQKKLFQHSPQAAALFMGHVNFSGYGEYHWTDALPPSEIELIAPAQFLRRYNHSTGPFGSMSYCCVPKSVLTRIGAEPFRVSGVDDSYLCSTLPLLGGPIVYCDAPLVAYRLTAGAQSHDKLKAYGLWLEVFELLEERYRNEGTAELKRVFTSAFSAKRRSYSKLLMGAGQTASAREQLRRTLSSDKSAISVAKSLFLLVSTYLPISLQPKWPKPSRKELA
jgi:glycosyltransferase involved in cell wall biosynthesis